MLLYSDVRDDVGYFTIVGAGGLGKTTLAQLVYHDERIKHDFPLRLWACVSDQDGEHFDVKTIVAKILESVKLKKHDRDLGMDLLQRELQEELGGNKFLLVLDDVWTEDRYKWSELRKFLSVGERGSRVVVTSRSKITATIVGSSEHSTYELQGLSKVNSWRLFEMTAFGRHNQAYPHELFEIGQKIVENCHDAPLAIKVVGSLLFGQDVRKWRSFQEIGLAKIKKGENEIMSIIKLSYNSLESPLKTCFKFCALFPKNYVLCKRKLISLWMAQQYIVPFDGGQSIEDAGEEYFSILLRRSFFQDAENDEYGEVYSCKIHNLMHDVAQDVAGKEIYLAKSVPGNMADTTRHIFHHGSACTNSFPKIKIRSYIRDGYNQLKVSLLLASWRWLRVLDLHDLGIKSLPDSIGNLLHLRNLDLSENRNLKALPSSITNLYNLQTLNLSSCCSLLKLPKDLSKLVNLRCLLLNDCSWLLYMPPGMDKLTRLHVLSKFVVAKENLKGKQCVGKLKDLKTLRKLRDSIDISIRKSAAHVRENDSEGYLRSMEHLQAATITFEGCKSSDGDYRTVVNYHCSLLENLQPHSNLKGLGLTGFQGVNVPRWGRDWASFLPNLVKISLKCCHGLPVLPSLSKLHYLKSLELSELTNLEHMENACSSSNAAFAEKNVFFPSLKSLVIWKLPKLKGWWRGLDNPSLHPPFLYLSALSIERCPNLTSFPSCPSLEQLCLTGLNETLRIRMGRDDIGETSASHSDTRNSHPELRSVALDNLGYFKSMPVEHLVSMSIRFAEHIESLSQFGEVFKGCSSLRNLMIQRCYNLRSLSGGLEHLTALESLLIEASPSGLTSEGDHAGIHWICLNRSLRSLEITEVFNLEFLPKELQYLSSLRHLKIDSCSNFIALPEWIDCLSSLQSLSIIGCYELKSLPSSMRNLTSLQRLEIKGCREVLSKRCRNPNGEDWPKIQHVSFLTIGE